MALVEYDLGNGRKVYRFHRDRPAPARSDLPSPMVVIDCMEPVEHPHDGKLYDSKSAFRRTTRQNGYVEVGTEKLKAPERKAPDRKGIRESLQRAKAALSA